MDIDVSWKKKEIIGNQPISSHRGAEAATIDQIVSVTRAEDTKCDFQWAPWYLHTPLFGVGTKSVGELKQEATAARKLGFDAALIPGVPGFNVPGIRFPIRRFFTRASISPRSSGRSTVA